VTISEATLELLESLEKFQKFAKDWRLFSTMTLFQCHWCTHR